MSQQSSEENFIVLCIAQRGRLEHEAVVFTRSFRATNPEFKGRLIVAEPTGARWREPTTLTPEIRAILEEDGAEILPFENRHFGEDYPYGNKIEALAALPAQPFIFFDTDTVFTAPLPPLDFSYPTASMRREGTWPEPPLYGPGYHEIWKCLYDRFGIAFEPTLDLSQPEEFWKRFLYFNAGWFMGADAQEFGARFLRFALSIRDETPDELACQSLDPWLDQIALPLVIASLGGGRPPASLDALDGASSCHYRTLPLLYARESESAIAMVEEVCTPNRIKKVIKAYEPIRKLVLQGKGKKIRALFDQNDLPRREKVMRNRIKREGLWLR
ncbi:hypothetical protein [Thioclava sp. GXIMD2076]|uniref:hypothetical protein n=1 Tax=unclassified Thioclava TaxID=2621713 RepID=UPI0030D34310